MRDNLVLLNNHKMRGHSVTFIESTGKGHTEANHNYCCVIMVNGEVAGCASGKQNKKEAKDTAAAAAVEFLCL
jgi:Double-stranded RNA binding motif